MIGSRALRPFILAATMLCSSFSLANVLPASTLIHLAPEAGNSASYELNGPVVWKQDSDGNMHGYNNASNANDGVNMFFEHSDGTWLLQFVAPLFNPDTGNEDGQPLHVGRYDNVSGDSRHAPHQAGMLISSPLSMVWDWSGWFNVREIAYGSNGDLSRFAVDFMQYDTLSHSGPGLAGSLRFNSAVPLADVPEPGTTALMLAGLALIGAGAMRRRQARQRPAAPYAPA